MIQLIQVGSVFHMDTHDVLDEPVGILQSSFHVVPVFLSRVGLLTPIKLSLLDVLDVHSWAVANELDASNFHMLQKKTMLGLPYAAFLYSYAGISIWTLAV